MFGRNLGYENNFIPRDHMEDLRVDGSIILQLIFKK
jgi:hypothetical protein